MLCWSPHRLSATKLLKHAYFTSCLQPQVQLQPKQIESDYNNSVKHKQKMDIFPLDRKKILLDLWKFKRKYKLKDETVFHTILILDKLDNIEINCLYMSACLCISCYLYEELYDIKNIIKKYYHDIFSFSDLDEIINYILLTFDFNIVIPNIIDTFVDKSKDPILYQQIVICAFILLVDQMLITKYTHYQIISLAVEYMDPTNSNIREYIYSPDIGKYIENNWRI